MPENVPILQSEELPADSLDVLLAIAFQSGAAETLADDAAPASAVLALLEPPLQPGELGRLRHYRILELLGRGGMGVVFKARDEKLQRVVALKLMTPRLAANPAARERFLREARAAAAIRHDHVIGIYDVEEGERLPYLVMEYVAGPSLQEVVDGTPLNLKETLRLGQEIASGLAAAHDQGLIHRDVKPGNILLEGPGHKVKITDFGLALAADEIPGTPLGVVAGTPQYMAPEQARGASVDHRADLFSLGGVLYALCTGGQPFDAAGGTPAVLWRVCEDEPSPVRSRNPAVPAWLAAVIAKLLAKDPDQRYGSASEVAELLAAHQAGPSRQDAPKGRRALVCLVAAAVLIGAAMLVSEIIIRVRNQDGTTTETKLPEGARVEIEQGGKVVAVVPTNPGPHELRRFEGHTGEVWSVAMSRDGRRVVSAGRDGWVRVWDTATGKIVTVYGGHKHGAFGLALSPDGRHVLSCGGRLDSERRGDVCLWELKDGKELRRLDVGAVTCIALSKDGGKALIGQYDGVVLLWDVRDWKELRRFEHAQGLWSVCFSADEHIVLVAGGSQDVPLLRTCDLATGVTLRDFQGHKHGVWQASFSPDDQLILSAGGDRTLRLWNAHSGKEERKISVPDAATSVAFAADGKHALSSNYGLLRTIWLWNLETGAEVQSFSGQQSVQSVVFSPDGRWALSGGHDKTVRLWELPKLTK